MTDPLTLYGEQENRLRVLSLFSGIGGIDLGLERAGMQVIAHSEVDPYACRVLAKRWPDVPNLGDITKWRGGIDPDRPGMAWFDDHQTDHGYGTWYQPDVIAGGFPCQDISVAGRMAGIRDGERSGLWSEFLHAIDSLRPRYAIIENVRGRGFEWADVVAGDLAAIGYRTHGRTVWASDFYADHQRPRAFLVAHPEGMHGPAFEWHEPHRVAAQGGPAVRTGPLGGWGADQSRVGRTRHGVPHRVDRLRGLSNAVCPPCAEYVGRLVVAHHRSTIAEAI